MADLHTERDPIAEEANAGAPINEPTGEATNGAASNGANGDLPTPEQVRGVIQEKVQDPELMLNIVDLGLIYNVEITEKKSAEITMTLTSPGCPAGPEIITNVQRETHNAYPALEDVNIHLVWSPFWNPEMMSDEAKDELGIF